MFNSKPKLSTIIGVAAGVGVGLVAPPLLLGAVGFGSGGVVAGSLAAATQSAIGNVAAGSLFAACQSAGAAGLAASTTAGFGAASGLLGGVVGSMFGGSSDDELCDRVLTYMKSTTAKVKYEITVEVRCPEEESTKALQKVFDKVVRIDESESFTKIIKDDEKPVMTTRSEKVERRKLKDGSVDLVTVGPSLPYSNWAKFYDKVDRMLKPGGVIAIFTPRIQPFIVNHKNQDKLNNFLIELLKGGPIRKYWSPGDEYAEAVCKNEIINIPYHDHVRDETLKASFKGEISELFASLAGTAPVRKFLAANGRDGKRSWEASISSFCRIAETPEDGSIEYEIRFVLMMGRKSL